MQTENNINNAGGSTVLRERYYFPPNPNKLRTYDNL